MDIQLHYEEYGSGFPLILLHGNGESSEYFKGQLDAFSERYRVIAVDTRGHGRSPRGTAPFTLDQFADDLYEFMRERKILKAHILGFSDGGNVALLFALKHPAMVDRLILNGANLSPQGVKASVQIPIVIGYGLVALLSRFDRQAIAKKELLGLMVTQPNLPPEALKGLTMPVLVIAGNRDMIKDAHTRQIAAAIPGAKLQILPGTHFVAAENAPAFNRCVLGFL